MCATWVWKTQNLRFVYFLRTAAIAGYSGSWHASCVIKLV
jgi:hypothetical protein